ncbi:major head protein [Erwinia phage vB_EamP-S6]|uniref:Major capsid protein n=1 Tax=Erwinia phage vB_EamP-S6 TaxID=1051675 RepID=G0YQH7_9CAUD|nr:major head protein [Erwinia phage vB_EamP-S6]AEJ81604.1 major capsid protein [Erwinia phage vB_EamP-S6]
MASKGMLYNDPNTTPSGIDAPDGKQMNTFFWWKKALIEARKDQYFMPLADVVSMPKNYGKEIRVYHYIPLLDDRNVNDQGIDAAGATIVNGNLYGSSKDIGTIVGKIPTLTETGGRVNRVGFSRISRVGRIQKFGFFTEFSQESLDFDSDSELFSHISTELMNGAVQLTEAVLQKDLLAGAGTIVYTGAATQDSEITGEGATPSVVDYDDLMRLSITLDENRTPKQTKVITGSRMIDTRTISAGRVLYIGSELIPLIRKLVDPFGNAAFVPVHQYADAGTILNGEIGTVDQFRLVVVPEMLHWAGAGATVGTNPGYRETNGKYDIYPMLCVGAESFTTIGFQTDGKTLKFKVTTKMPGEATADRNDPYGEMGFSSIKWYYGTLILRPERLALVKTVAPL